MKSMCLSILILLSACQTTIPCKQHSQATKAMVVSAHNAASTAGRQVLLNGGNAIDAAVTVSFVLAVVRPQSTGIGGGGFLLYHEAKKNQQYAFDFRERAPALSKQNMFAENGKAKPYRNGTIEIPYSSRNGPFAAGTPGLVRGIVEIHKRFGKLPLADLIQPAIDLADKGFAVYQELVDDIQSRENVLRLFPASAAIFLPDGKPPKLGETLIQKDLAQTLKRIAATAGQDFYQGQTAKLIVASMTPGLISLNDLKSYRLKERKLIEGTYRGHKIISMPPPSSGGIHIVEMLNILENYPITSLKHNSTAYIHLLAESMRRAYAHRAVFLGDPDYIKIPVKQLISKASALKLAQGIDLKKADSSKNWQAPKLTDSPQTTHFSIVDAQGNAVSSTQTINGNFGSGMVAPGTGIVLNNEMDDFATIPNQPNLYGLVGTTANAVAPGKTMLSSMSPSFVYAPNGKLYMICGSPGGSKIITATMQTILNVIDFNMPISEAVAAPRVHHQCIPDEIIIEPGVSQQTSKELEAMGHIVKHAKHATDVQAITVQREVIMGASDPRSCGQALGY